MACREAEEVTNRGRGGSNSGQTANQPTGGMRSRSAETRHTRLKRERAATGAASIHDKVRLYQRRVMHSVRLQPRFSAPSHYYKG